MKVQTVQHTVVSEGAGVERTAKIKESAKAFHILSGALYSDKILAVVRELSCNAYDAQVDAGNEKTPFEIKAPTEFDNTFYIKDFGTGLSEEQIYGLYMTYFDSTKTNSDEFIGQLGLGSKSPFSYGATFNVESRQNGVKKIYTCYKNAELVPAVSLMDTANTDEPNGLTISLSAKRGDIDAFQRAIGFATMYFKVPPKIVGTKNVAPYELKYVAEGNNWKMRSNNSVYDNVRVIQGAVSYPVDLSLVNEMVSNKLSKFIINRLRYFRLDLLVPIGQLDIAPSREALSYDLRTATNLANILVGIEAELIKNVQDTIQSWPTLWDAYCQSTEVMYGGKGLYPHHFKAVLSEIGYRSPLWNWRGHEVNGQNIEVLEAMLGNLDSLTYSTYSGTTRRTKSLTCHRTLELRHNPLISTPWKLTLTPSSNLIVIIDDVNNDKISRSLLTYNLWLGGNNEHIATEAIVISATNGVSMVKAELDALLKALGSPPTVLMSSLPVAKKSTTQSKYKAKAKDELLVWKGLVEYGQYNNGYKVGAKSWETQTIDLSDGGYYLNIDRFTITDNTFNHLKLPAIIQAAKLLELIPKDALIVGLSSTRKDYVCSQGKWLNLIDAIAVAGTKQTSAWTILLEQAGAQDWLENDGRMVAMFNQRWSSLFEASTTNNQKFVDHIKSFAALPAIAPIVGHIGLIVMQISSLNKMNSVRIEHRNKLSSTHDKVLADNRMLKFIKVDEALCDKGGIALISKALTK